MIRALFFIWASLFFFTSAKSQTYSTSYTIKSAIENTFEFANSIDVQGNIIVASSLHRYSDAASSYYNGQIQIFEYNPESPEVVNIKQIIYQEDTTRTRSFVKNLHLQNDFLVAGLKTNYVRIYNKNEFGEFTLAQILPPQDSTNYISNASSIAADDSTLFVSDHNSTFAGENAGSVDVYTLNKTIGEWEFKKRLLPETVSAFDTFGEEIKLLGDILVVGADNDDREGENSGVVYIFERNLGGEGNWGLQKTLTIPGGRDRARFGHSIDLKNDLLVVGAPRSNVTALDGGAVYVFKRNLGGENNWGLAQEILPEPTKQYGQFGQSVFFTDEQLLIKSDITSQNSRERFHQYSFNSDDDSWFETTSIYGGYCFGDNLKSEMETLFVTYCGANGAIRILTYSPLSYNRLIDFGDVNQFDLKHKNLSITNVKDESFELEVVSMPDHVKILNQESLQLTSKNSMSLSFEFTPQQPGEYLDTLVLKDQNDSQYLFPVYASVDSHPIEIEELYSDIYGTDVLRFIFKLDRPVLDQHLGGFNKIDEMHIEENSVTRNVKDIHPSLSSVNELPSSLKTILVIDTNLETESDLELLKSALIDFVGHKIDKHQLKLVVMNQGPTTVQNFTADVSELKQAIETLSIIDSKAELYYSMKQAFDDVESVVFGDSLVLENVVVFTTSNFALTENEKEELEEATVNKSIYIHALGEMEHSLSQDLFDLQTEGYYYNKNFSELRTQLPETYGALKNHFNSYYGLTFFTTFVGENEPHISLRFLSSNNQYFDERFDSFSFSPSDDQIIINRTFKYPFGTGSITSEPSAKVEIKAETNVDNSLSDFTWSTNDSSVVSIQAHPFHKNKVVLKATGEVGESADITIVDEITGLSKTITYTIEGMGVANELDEASDRVAEYKLHQNYPNPFNPSTNISFYLPQSAEVNLTVYDVTGRLVATLENGLRNAGSHVVPFDASALSSGMYFYKIEAGDFSETRKMMLIK
ncbi:MAG: T9SS type A sorting domain-containing protein [Balneolaceae bacterium]|nr:T9SS type A sorting domain-containing protein [Balneolaceae bacterium]